MLRTIMMTIFLILSLVSQGALLGQAPNETDEAKTKAVIKTETALKNQADRITRLQIKIDEAKEKLESQRDQLSEAAITKREANISKAQDRLDELSQYVEERKSSLNNGQPDWVRDMKSSKEAEREARKEAKEVEKEARKEVKDVEKEAR